MQSTSALYKAIFAQEHTAEVKVNIAGVDYGEDVLVSMSTSGGLFADSALSIGGAAAKEIDLTLWNITASIPKMAKIVPYYRLRAGQQVSEWVQRGVYYIDTRTVEGGLLTIHGYDDMLKAEQVWAPDQSLTFPMPMESVVTLIAELMGVPVDSRTQVGNYTIDYPANDYTLRNVLRYIAAASAGNWTMTDAGALRLVKVQPLPPEGATPTVEIGQNASAVETAPPLDPISKVILLVDDENYYQAGADTGMTLEATCPYGTQQMANDILSAVNGYQYQPAQAAEALMDPAAELGDPMTVDDIYTVIAELATTFDALMAADVGAPGQDEIESEYPYQSKQAAEVDRKIAQTRSEIKKTSEEISAEIEAADGRISALELTVDGITLSVSQPIESGGQSYVEISLTVGQNTSKGYVRIDGNVDISGTLSAQALYAVLGDIAQLTVDSLATSRRIPLYLAGDQGDDNYIRIQGQSIQFVTGSTAGATEQATDPTGAELYWDQDISGASIGSDGYPYVDGARVFTTTERTSWPVMVYIYTEQVKREITFEEIDGLYTPVDTFGAGDQNGRRKGVLIKGPTSMELMYTDALGNEIGVEMSDDGYTDIYGMRKPTEIDFSSWDNGSFIETIDGGGQNTYQVEFDSSGQPVKIKDPSGHETVVVW